MDATSTIAQDLFFKIRSRFSGLKLGDMSGAVTIIPEDSRFFDFDYTENEKVLGHVSVSLAEPNSMKVYFSSNITEAMDGQQKDNWYRFLRELRQFAKRRLMSFDTRDIAKDNLDKRDFKFLSANSAPKTQPNQIVTPVGENVMSESQLYGSKTVSYQKLLDTKLIIKHSKAVMDDTQPGARARNISALFVENQDGERFKYPFIHLAGARAMQRHVANGGLPYDDIGKSIVQMSEEIAQLRSFSSYVVRNDLMNSDTNSIVERSTIALDNLREQIKALSKQSHYESYKENFQIQETIDIPEDIANEYTEKFTIRNFKEDIKSVFPILYKLMKEDNTLGYDDIVAMTDQEVTEESTEEDPQEAYDPFSKFEQWVSSLGEESQITSNDKEEQNDAIQKLQDLVGEHFPAGVDGTNAITSLEGIIEDPELYKEIKDQAKEDPDSCVRPLVKQWLENNAPEVVDQLDFGDMVDEPAADQGGDQTAPEEEPQMAADDPDERNKKDDEDDLPFEPDENPTDKDEFGNTIKHRAKHLAKKGMRQVMDVKELAEFITSFYDKDSGTFPKGPEGVCTMVGKKFGEQAEMVARKFVERMAPHQEAGAEQMQELARIRELAGMKIEGTPYDDDEDDDDLNDPDNPMNWGGDINDRIAWDDDRENRRKNRQKNEEKQEGDRIRDMSPEEDPDDVGDSFYDEDYAFALASRVFKMNPNLSAKGSGDEVVDAAYEIMVKELGKKRANYILQHDEDFVGDLLDTYSRAQHHSKSKGEDIQNVSPELEDIRRLSGIAQGLGY